MCKGKFSGCGDVWARGARPITVRVRPDVEPLRRVRAVSTLEEVGPVEVDQGEPAPPAGPGPGPRRLDGYPVAVVDELADKVRRLESAVESAANAPPPSPRVVRAADDGRVEALTKAVANMAAGLDHLAGDVKELRAVPARMEALERRAASSTPAEASEVRKALKAMWSRVEDLDKSRARLEAGAGPRPAAAPGPDDAAAGRRVEQRLEQLAARVAPLDQLVARVAALETAEAPAVPDVSGQVEKLAAQLSALEARGVGPLEHPGHQGRINAMEKVLAGLVQGIERLSARVAALDEVPKRLEALETAESPLVGRVLASMGKRLEALETAQPPPTDGPPLEKVLVSMGKRLDRLSTQVGELKGLPDRVRAIEEEPVRTESISRGLGGAIDMIDQLSAEVTAIKRAGPAGNGSPG
ncbi:MAG: hypothetical protein M3N37_00360 [Actinomycetota bacterium]|nr:hypothetical protein [Actinomycetota bacterium]